MEDKMHKCIYRHHLLFKFNRHGTAVNAAHEICEVYGENTISDRAAQKWFAKFRNDNFDLNDAPSAGQQSNFDESHLNALLKGNARLTTRELAEQMNCGQNTIYRHVTSMDKVQKMGTWVPQALTENQKHLCFTIAADLLALHRGTHEHKSRFVHRIVTGDEKWCLYANFKRRKEWVE